MPWPCCIAPRSPPKRSPPADPPEVEEVVVVEEEAPVVLGWAGPLLAPDGGAHGLGKGAVLVVP